MGTDEASNIHIEAEMGVQCVVTGQRACGSDRSPRAELVSWSWDTCRFSLKAMLSYTLALTLTQKHSVCGVGLPSVEGLLRTKSM